VEDERDRDVAVRQLLLSDGWRGIVLRLGIAVPLLALGIAAYAVWLRPSEFSRAAELLPPDTARVLWTDWAGVRAELDCADWSGCRTGLEDSDLAAASVLPASAEAVTAAFGWGPQTISWELLGQGVSGQVLAVQLEGRSATEAVADSYEEAGFTRPSSGRLDGGIWEGGPDVLADHGVAEALFGNVAFLADRDVLLSSDDPRFLAKAVDAARSGGLDFGLAGHAGEPLAAVGLTGDRACTELGFATADPGAAAEAESLVADAGGVEPLDGYLVALGPDRAWTAAFGFEDDARADHDLLPRQRLAAADDPGQMESYPDLFTVEEATTSGRDVVLRGTASRSSYALTQLTQGPVLLASC
jgi:hypothetical protein